MFRLTVAVFQSLKSPDHRLGLCLVQVVFLPGFGCLYIDVTHEGGTLVLSLAPEGSVDAVANQQSRYSMKYILCLCLKGNNQLTYVLCHKVFLELVSFF